MQSESPEPGGRNSRRPRGKRAVSLTGGSVHGASARGGGLDWGGESGPGAVPAPRPRSPGVAAVVPDGVAVRVGAGGVLAVREEGGGSGSSSSSSAAAGAARAPWPRSGRRASPGCRLPAVSGFLPSSAAAGAGGRWAGGVEGAPAL